VSGKKWTSCRLRLWSQRVVGGLPSIASHSYKTRAYIVTHQRKERKEQHNRIKVQHDARSKDKNCKDKVRIQYALNGDRYRHFVPFER
jgi:hypothetical protein